MAKNIESNADKAFVLANQITKDKQRVAYIADKIANDPRIDTSIYKKALMVNEKSLAKKTSELEKLIKMGGANLGKVIKKLGPVGGALAGIVAAIDTGDVSAAVPILNEAENVGPERGSLAYKLESGEKLTPEEMQILKQQQLENIRQMAETYPKIESPKLTPSEIASLQEKREDQIREFKTPPAPVAVNPTEQDPLDLDYKAFLDWKKNNMEDWKNKIRKGESTEEMAEGGLTPLMKENYKYSVKKEKGGLVDGKKNEYVGDRVDAKLNRGEMVLNVEQQQRLMDLLRGKSNDLPNEDIVENKYQDGGVIPSELDIANNPQIPLAPVNNTPVLPSALTPTAPIPPVTTNPVISTPPIVPVASSLPESMKYTGAGATEFQTPSLPASAQMTQPTPVAPQPVDLFRPTEEEIQQAAAPIREERAQTAAMQQQLSAQMEQNNKERQLIIDSLKEEDKKVSEIDPNRFWKNLGTGQKILAGISMALGSIGAAISGGENIASKIIFSAIDNDIEAQKLGRSEELAKKNQALQLAKFKLDEIDSRTVNEERKLRISALKQQINMQQQAVQQQRLFNKALQQGQVSDPSLLPKEDRERAVIMKDGSLRLALNTKSAAKVRDYQNEVTPAIESIDRMREMGKEGIALPFTERAARYNTELQALIGNLRLPITGPGILTDTERKMLAKIIGNPTAIFSLSNVENAKLDQLQNKLSRALNAQYKNAGITPPSSIDQQNIERIVKSTGKSAKQAETYLRNTNQWYNE